MLVRDMAMTIYCPSELFCELFFCQQSAKFAENNPIKTIDMQSKFEWKKIKTVYHLIGWNIRTKYVYDKKKAENKYDRA